MRYKWKEEIRPKIGEERIITKYLYFPKTLYSLQTSNLETRWLEKCNIVQVFEEIYLPYDDIINYYKYVWVDRAWADNIFQNDKQIDNKNKKSCTYCIHKENNKCKILDIKIIQNKCSCNGKLYENELKFHSL